jgi:hypothetical protein
MRAEMIIFVSLHFDLFAGVLQRKKPVRIQVFVAKGAVEEFDERVIDRLARTGVIQRDAMIVGKSDPASSR